MTTYMLECTSSRGRGRFLLAEGIRETDPKFEIPGRSRASNRNPALGEHGEGDADFGLVIPKFQPYQPLLPQGNLNTGAKNKNCILFTRNGPESNIGKSRYHISPAERKFQTRHRRIYRHGTTALFSGHLSRT